MSEIEDYLEKIRAERIARRSFPLKEDKVDRKMETATSERSELGASCEVVGAERVRQSQIENKLIELKKNEPSSNDIFKRLTIIGYEFGYVQRALAYAEIFGEDIKERKIHLANAKLEIADLITQIHLLCIILEIDFEELRKLGVQHLEERQEEFKKYGWKK